MYTDTLSDNFCDAVWDSESRNKATALMYALTTFEFIITVYQEHIYGEGQI